MTKYTLTFNPTNINFAPANELEEIYQNINTILSTYKASVPLLRDFGISANFIDKPMTIVHPLYVLEVIETIERWEERVVVEDVKLSAATDTMEGSVYPIITFSLRNEVTL